MKQFAVQTRSEKVMIEADGFKKFPDRVEFYKDNNPEPFGFIKQSQIISLFTVEEEPKPKQPEQIVYILMIHNKSDYIVQGVYKTKELAVEAGEVLDRESPLRWRFFTLIHHVREDLEPRKDIHEGE